jgi:hypothetical protein
MANLAVYGGAFLGATYGPALASKLPAATEALQQFLFEKATDRAVLEFLSDVVQGYTPGAVPATLGGLTGPAIGYIQSNWSQFSRSVQEMYQQLKANVPY